MNSFNEHGFIGLLQEIADAHKPWELEATFRIQLTAWLVQKGKPFSSDLLGRTFWCMTRIWDDIMPDIAGLFLMIQCGIDRLTLQRTVEHDQNWMILGCDCDSDKCPGFKITSRQCLAVASYLNPN